MDKERLFNKYLHGELGESEFNEFKAQLDTNVELRQELRIHEVMFEDRVKRIKNQLKSGTSTEKVHQLSNHSSNSIQWIRRLAAIFIIALGALFVMKFFLNQPVEYKDLVSQYVSEKHLPPSVSMGENSDMDYWQLAIEAYRNGEFEIAKDQLQKIETPTDEQKLYYGLSHMYAKTPEYTKALSILEMINENGDSIAQDEALWYSSLLHLVLNDKEKAKLGLKKIVNNQSWRFKDAEKLLKDNN